jgi:hypothetical protein
LLSDAVGLPLVMLACGPLFAVLAAGVIARLPKALEA